MRNTKHQKPNAAVLVAAVLVLGLITVFGASDLFAG
jgi:hypothetical protein